MNLKHVEKSEMTSKNPSLRGNVKMEEKKEKFCYLPVMCPKAVR